MSKVKKTLARSFGVFDPRSCNDYGLRDNGFCVIYR